MDFGTDYFEGRFAMTETGYLGHDRATAAIDAIRSILIKDGAGAAVAVVDDHGELVALLKTDGCPLASINNAVNKAYTAARERVPSGEVGRRSRDEHFPMSNFGDLRYTGWGGGLPVTVDDVVIGAVGVSGLTEDEDIALAAVGVAAAAEG
jgi:glc operon protein GlcG